MVSIGGMDITKALIEAEQRIIVLEKIIQELLNAKVRTEQMFNIDVLKMRDEAVEVLQKKYPDLGIQLQRND